MFTGLILLFAVATPDLRPPVFFTANDELRQYLMEAAQNNPNLKARYADWQAALEKFPQVTTLEDPMLGYTQFLESDQYIAQLMVEQKFPWFGTLRTRGDKAAIEANAALARFYAARNQLFAQVKNAYFEYAFLAETTRIIESQTEVLAQLEESIRARYSLGIGMQADVLRIQTEKDRLLDQLKGLGQSRPAVSARLLEALGREAAAPELDWPQPMDFPPPPPPAPVVLAQIRAANPDLEAMQRMIESREKDIILARKAGYPDITAGLGYMFMKDPKMNNGRMRNAQIADAAKMLVQDAPMNGLLPTLGEIGYDAAKEEYLKESEDMDDEITVSLKVNVPIWRKRIKAGIREAERMRESAQYDKLKSTLSYDTAARTSLYNYQDAERRYRLYKDVLIPRERQTYESLLAGYSAGVESMEFGGQPGAVFIDLQNSLRAVLEFQMQQAQASRDLQMAAAELEMLMGGPWTGKETETPVQTEKLPAPAAVAPEAAPKIESNPQK